VASATEVDGRRSRQGQGVIVKVPVDSRVWVDLLGQGGTQVDGLYR
jgi:hypothetical protein